METKNYKYDATIFLLIHLKDSNRIKQFNEIGIVNCNKNKILLCFLTGTEIKSQGSLVIFPSFVKHRVKPVTKGTRYSLVIWNLGQPYK